MKSLRIFLISLSVGLFIISCQKEHITTTNTTVGNPVFYFNGTVGSNNVSLQAGKSNYYMYSSYSQNSVGVYSFIGNLKEFGCSSNCVSSIEFIINNYRALASGQSETNINTALTPSNYAYYTLGNSVTQYTISYIPTSVGAGSASVKKFTFNYGDGTDTSGSILPNQFIHTYSAFGHYNTILSVTFSDGVVCTDSMPSSFLPKDSNKNNFSSSIFLSSASADTLAFIDTINPVPAYANLYWNFGDGTTYNSGSCVGSNPITHTFNSSNTIYNVRTYIVDTNTKDTVFSTFKIKTATSLPQKDIINYSASAPTIKANSQNLSNVSVIYTDPTGDIYTTADSITQKVGSNFQIVSVVPYNNNENNQTTKQLHIKFDCTLYDNKGKSLTITGGDAVIAVAYK